MKTFLFSETFNLFKLPEVLTFVKECLLRFGVSRINTTSLDKEAKVHASRKGVSITMAISEGMIVDKSLKYLQGQPSVKIGVAVTSQDNNTLAWLIEEFKRCLLIRVSRGGG